MSRTAAEQGLVDRIDAAMRAWHARDLDTYFELYAEDAVLHHTHGDFDLAGARMDYEELFAGMPDATVAFHEVIVEGELVAMTFTLTGTAEGQSMTRTGLSMLRFVEGRCAERWTSTH